MRLGLSILVLMLVALIGCGGGQVQDSGSPDASNPPTDENPSTPINPVSPESPTCKAAVPCQPDNSCMQGETVCATPYSNPVCMAKTPKADGINCGGDNVCNAGACVPKSCHAGTSCVPSDPCSTGVIACASATAPGTCQIASRKPDGASCGNGLVCQAGSCAPLPPQVAKIEVKANTELMIADGVSHPTLTIRYFSPSGEEKTGIQSQLYANGHLVSGSKFTTTTPGDYSLVVRVEGVESNVVKVTARENKNYPWLEAPVLFHVDSNYPLSTAEISKLLNRLNNAFANKLGSTDPNAVSLNIRFRLATKDLSGNNLPESGIDRISTAAYDIGGGNNEDVAGDRKFGPNEAWRLMGHTFWDPRKYFEIWLIPTYSGRSAAGSPFMTYGHGLGGLTTLGDAVVLNPDPEMFRSFTLDVNDRERSIAHEAGHTVGLLHTFSQNGCQTDDYCPDTWSYDYDTGAACPGNRGENDEKTNQMDYTLNQVGFTYDQRERVRQAASYAAWLPELFSSDR